jgi:hypothetical protein
MPITSTGVALHFKMMTVMIMKTESLSLSFFFVVLGFELRVSTLSHSTSPLFVMGFYKIGSHERFALAGFEPQSS